MSGIDLSEPKSIRFPFLYLLREYGRNNIHYLLGALVLKSIAVLVSLADIFVIGLAFDALFNDKAYQLPLIPDAWIPSDPINQVVFTAGLLLAIKATDILGTTLGQAGFHLFTQRLMHDIRTDTFDTAQRLELGFFEEHDTGDIMSVFNNDVNNLERFLSEGLDFILWVIVTLASSFLFMFYLNWQFALLVLLAGPVLYRTNAWFAAVLEHCQDRVRSEVGKLNTQIEISLSGIDVVKAFNSEEQEIDRVENASTDHYRARWDNRRIAVRQQPSYRLINGTVLLLVLAVGTYWVVNGPSLFLTEPLTAGMLIPFLMYIQRITTPMELIGRVTERYESAKASSKRITAISTSTRTLETDNKQSLGGVEGRVEYEDISFSYPESDDTAIRDVSFRCDAGDTVGIVGASGAGKSTLIKLLLRFYDVDSGAIRIDGRDVQKIDIPDLRDMIGYVDQGTFMFSGTVRDNIAYGVDHADETAIRRAAKQAGAHSFITDLSDGYDTEIGEHGTKLSGGQRQRLSLARALITESPILILDEATSHVDNRTEATIMNKLKDVTTTRTTFIVAHRLSTVRHADQILVMDDGEVVESGNHETLLDRDGAYATLWNVQVGSTQTALEGIRPQEE